MVTGFPIVSQLPPPDDAERYADKKHSPTAAVMTSLHSREDLPMSSCARVVVLFVAFSALLPGLLFGGLFLVFTPVNLIEGRGTWLAVCPVVYALVQIWSLIAWFRPLQGFGQIRFVVWSVVTILCSIVLIAELQRQINGFDEECGNLLLGPIFMQISAGGTVFGMLLLALDHGLWRSTNNFAVGGEPSDAAEDRRSVFTNGCSTPGPR